MKPLVKTTVGAEIPVFQAIYETVSGGFALDETVLAAGSTVKMGTVIGFDETTRKAKVCKVAINKNASGAGDTTYEVYKGHNLAVGMTVEYNGGTGRVIDTIDTSNANHDVITVAATLDAGVVPAGGAIYVDDYGYSSAKGLLLDETVIADGVDVSVLIRGTVYENRIVPISAALKALMPTIIFSKSY